MSKENAVVMDLETQLGFTLCSQVAPQVDVVVVVKIKVVRHVRLLHAPLET